ncbi:hypothetical protein WDU94_009445 [Cyamophila willieti]
MANLLTIYLTLFLVLVLQDLDDILDTRYFQFDREAPLSRRPSSCQRTGSSNSLLVNFFNNNSKKERKLSRTNSNSNSDDKNSLNIAANIYCRYKTELCRPYKEKGECKYGNKCQFAHGTHELRSALRHPKYKTEPCHKFHTTGFCNYGPRCTYIHNEEDDEMSLSGKVNSLHSEPSSSPSSFGSISPPPYSANTAFSFAPLVRLPSSSSSSDSNYTESRTSSPLSFEGKEYQQFNSFAASPFFSFGSLRNQLMT